MQARKASSAGSAKLQVSYDWLQNVHLIQNPGAWFISVQLLQPQHGKILLYYKRVWDVFGSLEILV